MTMCCIRNCYPLFGLFFCNLLFGQDNFTGYFEPDISLNYKVATNYYHNFKISQRNYIYDKSVQLTTRQLDISHFSNLKVRNDQSVALGIQYRFRENFEDDGENELRLTQQFNSTDQNGSLRFGHRFRTEQRINTSLTTHRVRYRFAVDFPLNGEKLDIGEAYLIASTESLLSMAQTKKPEYDQRFTINIGWLLSTKARLQTGMEYRAENYTRQNENIIFLLTSLILGL